MVLSATVKNGSIDVTNSGLLSILAHHPVCRIVMLCNSCEVACKKCGIISVCDNLCESPECCKILGSLTAEKSPIEQQSSMEWCFCSPHTTAPKDFVMKTTTVRFISGAQFSTPFNVEIVDDEVAECREEFSVEFIIPSEWRDRLKLVESNEAKVEVTDDDSE